ncbi:hypothetical protein [Oceanobacter mangrovi]|uniref:hypothetical protein n=1 Tax=Oceanobacter mangrovi TaxID=2862510 RepID=UPI001C8E5E9F|nr:hypothetical protein [Oceanobacter mangrovi]
MKKLFLFGILVSNFAEAADPFTSVFSETTTKLTEGLSPQEVKGEFKFFKFGETDSIFGGLSVSKSGDSQSIKINAVNYYIWFGGDKKLPFQLYYSDEAASDGGDENQDEVNTEKFIDPESGVAIKFPLLWTYQSSGDGFCAFLSDTNSIGHCSLGGDITLSFKDFTDTDGNSDTAFGQTVRVGAAVLFPIISDESSETSGYLSASAKIVYSHVNIDNPTQLFSPVLDANGEAVDFDKSILSSEVEIKWAFDNKIAISGRWLKPFDNKDYFDDLFKIGLETNF